MQLTAPEMPPTAAPRATATPSAEPYRRTYQACKPCRSAKVRCDLGSTDAPEDPPCRRCRRTGRECAFAGAYDRREDKQKSREPVGERPAPPSNSRDRGEPDRGFAISGQHGPTSAARYLVDPSPLYERGITVGRARFSHLDAEPSPEADASSFRFVRGETLENPADALRILCAAAEDERPQPTSLAEMQPAGSALWSQWMPVRDGLLTADEAGSLLAFFGDHMVPCHTVVPIQLFQPAFFDTILREPILLAAITSTAARYVDLGRSFDISEPSRSRVVQARLVKWLLERIGHLAMGEMSSRTIGTVEALLVLSEWPPRASLLSDTMMSHTANHTSSHNPSKVYDDLSWTLVGLAVRIAQELELHDEKTYHVNERRDEWTTLRRYRAWVHCLSADRHASVRLGRASLIQEMSTCWWEGVGELSKISGDTTFPFPRTQLRWREIRGIAELTHVIGLLQELLYVAPDVTAGLIRTGRFEITLYRLKGEMDSLWHLITGDLPAYPIFETDGNEFTESELREVRWRMEYDYVKLYANSIAMRAAQERLIRRFNNRDRGDRVFQASVIRSTEGPFILEAVDSAISLVKCGVTMHKKGVLRFCPARTFLRLVFASVFLMKAVSFGAVAQPEDEIVDLQYSLIDSLQAASVDDAHVAQYLATLLSRVFPSSRPHPPSAMPSQPASATAAPGESSGGIHGTAHGAHGAHTHGQPAPAQEGTQDFMGMGLGNDMFRADGHGGWDLNSEGGFGGWGGVGSGFGYDPSSLVSDIEEMLAASQPHHTQPEGGQYF